MSRQLHISTESHYLRAHLTVIAGESYDQRGAFHDLRRRRDFPMEALYESHRLRRQAPNLLVQACFHVDMRPKWAPVDLRNISRLFYRNRQS